jgi:ligand-binding SRPBCC domain-containing protein
MRIKISSRVPGHYKDVMSKFDRSLFEYLLPPFPKARIIEFTGSKKGDRVHISFSPPFKVDWISEITTDYEDQDQSYFVDKGIVLPPPLIFWEHKHIVQKQSHGNSYIIDDISYEATNKVLSVLIYPFLYFSFRARKRQYKKYFERLERA